jgi:hypothetical protein|nr:MAG TPA: hypothetical protein [Caudoviricetes sp.]
MTMDDMQIIEARFKERVEDFHFNFLKDVQFITIKLVKGNKQFEFKLKFDDIIYTDMFKIIDNWALALEYPSIILSLWNIVNYALEYVSIDFNVPISIELVNDIVILKVGYIEFTEEIKK